MAQNQSYAQYPYIAQPQNIYQQLGKPQPQPHLQSAYQQQPQQQQQLVHVPQQQPQYQYTYQHQQQQQQPLPIQNVQRVPSAQGFQSSSFPNSPAFTHQIASQPHQQHQQQSVYSYSPQGVQTPSLASTTYQQRPPSQNNSCIPTSSFLNLTPGHPMQNVLPRQIGNNQAAGQLVPASQSLGLRGASPAMPPGPPISPSAMFAQQTQAQRQPPPVSLGSAGRNTAGVPVQKQILPPPQTQTQSQLQLSIQQQVPSQPQSQPGTQPPPLPPRHQPQQQTQQQQGSPPKPATQRRPLPSPGAQRSFPSINTSVSSVNTSMSTTVGTPTSSSISNASPTRSGLASAQTVSQPTSPNKIAIPSSNSRAPTSPTKSSRPLPTPGGSSRGSNGGSSGGLSGSSGREGFAGIGAKKNATSITGLPVPSDISAQVANVNPFLLKVLPLPEGSTPDVVIPNNQVTEDSDGSLIRSRASPPKFQPDAISTSSSPTKATSPSTSYVNTPSSTISIPLKQGPSGSTRNQAPTSTSPTKNFAPTWKRTIPEYPQPVFGYAAGMVSDPWTPPKQQPTNTTNKVAPPPKKSASDKITHAEMRNLVEREHVERQLNAAMAQVHAQAHTQKRIAGMPVSNTSYSAYAMNSRSNPNLHQQQPSKHVRSAAYDDDDDDEEEEESEEEDGSEEDEEEEEDAEEAKEEQEARRRKHGRKPAQPTVPGKKKKKRKEKKEVKEKKVQKKSKPNSRSTSLPPKKRTSSRPPVIPSTSEDDTETTEMTQEETEEEYRRPDTRHAKSSSASSSRFKAKVEKEREMLRKKRSYQQDYVEEYSDISTSKKRDVVPIRRREPSPPVQQRQSYHQRPAMASAFRRRSPSPPYPQHSVFEYGRRQESPSPPPNHRTSRRVSPSRIGLLKDAQRKTIKLRGGNDDDDDVFIDKQKERREAGERWKKDERYRLEREMDDSYMDRNRYADERYTGGYHGHEEEDHYERVRQEERDARFASARNSGGRHNRSVINYFPQPQTLARRRGTEEREDQWSKIGWRDERDPKMFNLGRAESPPRPVRDSGFATTHRGRPASPTRNFPQHQSTRNNPLNPPLASPYHSQPVSPTNGGPTDERGSAGLVTKFTAIKIQGLDRSNGRIDQGEWPVDLPRLPRTPGETSNTSAGGYFDIPPNRDVYSTSGSGPHPPTEFARMSGRSPAAGNYDTSRSTGSARKNSHSPHHHSNLQMNLDDPPPRSLSPAISQGSNSYARNNDHLQHKRVQSQPQPITHSSMPQRRSVYNNNTTPEPEPPSPIKPRPQSQGYAHQTHPSQTPSPRPRSINPLDRANMNTSNIHNGTPKVQTINIESPAPVGGREKKADLNRMMSDPEDDGFATPVPRNSRRDDGNRRRNMNPSRESIIQVDSPRGPTIQIDESRGPIVQVESPRGPMIQVESPRAPIIQVDSPRGPSVNVDSPQGPMINVESSPPHNNTYSTPNVQVFNVPGISVAGPEFDDGHDHQRTLNPTSHRGQKQNHPRPNRGGLICGGCDGPIIGRIVSAMGARWHPQCFRCTVCNELLEHVSSYEHDGKPYCHLDYHENFAPRCFSCKTSIVEERFISLDDPALGKRTYHESHFFCAECGDPFLAPSMSHSSRTGELNVQGDGEFESDDVGFTVYKGHPYCEACHVRLRLPKCKKCKKSIRDHEQAVEALGGKWCWGCFVCANCERPFENPSFFQRGDKPFCERCFDIMLRNEV